MKRFRPRAKGRAAPILKPYSTSYNNFIRSKTNGESWDKKLIL